MSEKHLIDITCPDHYITRDGKDVLMIRKIEGDNLYFPLMVIFGDDTYASYETVTKYGEAHTDCESPNDILLRPELQQKQTRAIKKRKVTYASISAFEDSDETYTPYVIAVCDDGEIFYMCPVGDLTTGTWYKLPEIPQD